METPASMRTYTAKPAHSSQRTPLRQEPAPAPASIGPSRILRSTEQAPGVLRTGPVRPRNPGHVVIGSVDQVITERLFTEGLRFRLSDEIAGRAAFLRCSVDDID